MTESTTIPSPVGESVPRIDAREKVTGAAKFADDLQFGPGLLYARIKRSPHPHALIKKVDVSKTLALPGVKAVATGADTPGFIGLYLQDRHIFCTDRVRYVGDPVAGVAAINEGIAEQAVNLIEVKYEVLEPVLDPEFGVSPCFTQTWASMRSCRSFSPSPAPTLPTFSRFARATSRARGRSAPPSSSASIVCRRCSTFPSSRTWRWRWWTRRAR
jgi:hypothetical protein